MLKLNKETLKTTVMRVDLTGLLAKNPIVHPTRIERVVICGERLEMVVSGYPWWLDTKRDEPSQITLIFEALAEGTFPVPIGDAFDEDLESFSVVSLANIDWAQPSRNAIYCQEPLPDPARIYSLLQALLADAAAFKVPGDFLNQGHTLADFTKITSGHSYLLAHAPDSLCRLLCDELERQRVLYNVVESPTQSETRLWVRLNGAGFLCGAAWAEIEASAADRACARPRD